MGLCSVSPDPKNLSPLRPAPRSSEEKVAIKRLEGLGMTPRDEAAKTNVLGYSWLWPHNWRHLFQRNSRNHHLRLGGIQIIPTPLSCADGDYGNGS